MVALLRLGCRDRIYRLLVYPVLWGVFQMNTKEEIIIGLLTVGLPLAIFFTYCYLLATAQ